MLKFILTDFLALLTFLTFAQKADTLHISGILISANSNKPISDGRINFSPKKAILSDSAGHFTINGLCKGQYKLSFSALGYDNRDTIINIKNANVDNIVWIIATDCPGFSAGKALKDIKENKALLLLYGSIAPVIGPADKEFKKKFGVAYMIFGDDETVREECKKLYNKVVFDYLDKKFGKKWREEVRKDIVGYNDK
ncbi:MAG: carboxypeptidase-like regulatory domain-containing protein [Chitinophagaceae bacterium]